MGFILARGQEVMSSEMHCITCAAVEYGVQYCVPDFHHVPKFMMTRAWMPDPCTIYTSYKSAMLNASLRFLLYLLRTR